jgi:DNA repair protein RecN (Recombination protein N)
LDELARHDAGLGDVAAVLRDAESLIDDATHSLRHHLEKTDLDPRRLAAVEDRLSAWMGLARRLRRPPADLPELWQQWEAELAALERASQPDALEAACAQALKAYRQQAATLRALRAPAAIDLGQQITAAMQTLGMPGGRLEVQLRAEEAPQPWGSESVEFLVAGHAGVTPRTLVKVASGGELSRIALAIAVCTGRAQEHSAATVIFDEVDAGVGGAVADTVGQLLRQLGSERQVLAVTHLAQVASCAHQHWVVRKTSDANGTRSAVSAVEGEARVAELARMLGGERRTTSHAHAKTLLEDAQS